MGIKQRSLITNQQSQTTETEHTVLSGLTRVTAKMLEHWKNIPQG